MKKFITCLITAVSMLVISTAAFAADTPSWYPEDINSFKDFHASNAPKVVDDADLFTSSEELQLNERLCQITDQYDMDLVIYTTPTSYMYGEDHALLAADFYQFNGYGIGSDYRGSVLLICMEPGNRGWYTAACGSARDYYTRENINAIDDAIEDEMIDGDYFDAMITYTDRVDTLYKKGTLTSENSSDLGMHLIAAIIFGLIIGIIIAAVLTAGMKTVRIATTADRYIIPGSFNLRRSHDHFLYHTVTRVKRDNNSGSGGKSSFSGGFSSSGGRSFSGGGRKF